MVAAAPAAPVTAEAGANSLTVFPSEFVIEAQRGERLERTIGIEQTGARERDVSLQVSGAAAAFLSIASPGTGEPIDRLGVSDTTPSFVDLVIEPTAAVADGRHTARVRVVALDAEVAIGSDVAVAVDVAGDRELSVRLLDASVPGGALEAGRPLRLELEVDVRGTTALIPTIALTLDAPDGSTSELAARPPPTEPDGRHHLEASWSTRGWEVGRYTGDLVLSADAIEIDRAEIAFDVVPPGTLTSGVTVLGARLASTAHVGGVAKVAVTVRNDGARDGRVVFAGDVWFGTGPIAPLRSDPVLVGPGETADVVVYAALEEPGTYRVRGRANIDGVESSAFSIDFDVVEDGAGLVSTRNVGLAVGGLVAAVGVVLLGRRLAA